MSEKNAAFEKMKAQLEFLNASSAVKDRLIIEFITVLTSQKIVIPAHITRIIETLYPGKLDVLRRIDEAVEKDIAERKEIADNEQQQKGEKETGRPALRVIDTKKTNKENAESQKRKGAEKEIINS